jgi:hypothetical protein
MRAAYVFVAALLATAPAAAQPKPVPAVGDEAAVADAWRRRRDQVPVEVTARVVRLLRDDSIGVHHQRFRVQIGTMAATVLVSHNVSVAGRVPVRVGDEVRVRGVYAWTRKGGVIRWTNHDPRRVHPAGFIRLRDRTYQ